MRVRALLFIITIGMMGCGPSAGSLLSPNEFNSRIHATTQIQLIDVRTAEEFAEGHLEGAVNMDYNDDSFNEQVSALTKTMAVYVYCRSGRRSAAAADQMKELGFLEVHDMDGGILAWREGSLPVVD